MHMKLNFDINQIIKWVDGFDINSVPCETRKGWHQAYTRAFLETYDAEYEDPALYLKESANDGNDTIAKPAFIAIVHMLEKYGMEEEQFAIASGNEVDSLRVSEIPVFTAQPVGVVIPNYNVNIDIINKEMKSNGYYNIRTNKRKDKDGMEWYIVGYNPVHQPDILDCLEYYYWIHYSPTIYRKSIMKNGLIPSEGNDYFKYFDARIYLNIFCFKFFAWRPMSLRTEHFKNKMRVISETIKKEHP